MGTNYYARIIPTKERKDKLKKAIDDNNFSLIEELVDKMYTKFEVDYNGNKRGGEIHLGKRSGGWKFLWNPNVYIIKNGHYEEIETEPGHIIMHYIPEPNTGYYLYPLTKEGIKTIIDREDVEIYDEYGEKQDKEEFWNMALNHNEWDGKEAYDINSYERDHPEEKSFQRRGELIDFLSEEGYEFTSKTRGDFYSDGLRFATSTYFS